MQTTHRCATVAVPVASLLNSNAVPPQHFFFAHFCTAVLALLIALFPHPAALPSCLSGSHMVATRKRAAAAAEQAIEEAGTKRSKTACGLRSRQSCGSPLASSPAAKQPPGSGAKPVGARAPKLGGKAAERAAMRVICALLLPLTHLPPTCRGFVLMFSASLPPYCRQPWCSLPQCCRRVASLAACLARRCCQAAAAVQQEGERRQGGSPGRGAGGGACLAATLGRSATQPAHAPGAAP